MIFTTNHTTCALVMECDLSLGDPCLSCALGVVPEVDEVGRAKEEVVLESLDLIELVKDKRRDSSINVLHAGHHEGGCGGRGTWRCDER
jgi:hypothetical protein